MKIEKWLAVAGVAALAFSIVHAQGGRPGGAGGQGGGRQGGMFRGGGPRLLLNEAVQKELKMNKAQIDKAQAAFGRQGGPGAGPGGAAGRAGGAGAVGAGGGRGGAGQGQGQGLTLQQREQRRLEQEKQVQGILNDKQFARYNQIVLQAIGPSALARKDVAAKVGLNAQQSAKVEKIQQDQIAAMRSMFQGGGAAGAGGRGAGAGGAARGGAGAGGAARGGAGAGASDPGAMRERLQKMREQNDKKILALLTPAQKAKWEALLGAPFKLP